MTKVAINLPDDLKEYVESSLRAGTFRDASDLVVALLYRAKEQGETDLGRDDEANLVRLRREVEVGTEQADRGDFLDFTAEDVIVSRLSGGPIAA